MTTFDHARALAYPMRPAGTDATVIMDEILVTIPSDQRRVCCLCDATIGTGETIRARFEVNPAKGGKPAAYRACGLCCAAMATAGEDGGFVLAARKVAGLQRRVG